MAGSILDLFDRRSPQRYTAVDVFFFDSATDFVALHFVAFVIDLGFQSTKNVAEKLTERSRDGWSGRLHNE